MVFSQCCKNPPHGIIPHHPPVVPPPRGCAHLRRGPEDLPERTDRSGHPGHPGPLHPTLRPWQCTGITNRSFWQCFLSSRGHRRKTNFLFHFIPLDFQFICDPMGCMHALPTPMAIQLCRVPIAFFEGGGMPPPLYV